MSNHIGEICTGISKLKRLTIRPDRLAVSILVGVFSGCTILTFAIQAYNSQQSGIPNQVRAVNPVTSTLRANQEKTYGATQSLPGVVVTLYPQGFEPKEITRPAGTFLLIVNDYSRLDSTSLRLENASGIQLNGAASQKETPRWIRTQSLAQGEYILREENHPQWVCEIHITN
jgi:hypothetical protein